MNWNREKLEAMVERSHALNLHLRDLTERRNHARSVLNRLRTQAAEQRNSYTRTSTGRMIDLPVSPESEIQIAEAADAYRRLDELCLEAETRWTAYGQVVRRCAQYAEEFLGYRGTT